MLKEIEVGPKSESLLKLKLTVFVHKWVFDEQWDSIVDIVITSLQYSFYSTPLVYHHEVSIQLIP